MSNLATTTSTVGTVKALLDKQQQNLLAVLPKEVSIERFTRIALSCIARDSKLAECSPQSLVRSIVQAAELGLEIGGALGEAYLVPFKRKSGNGWEMQATLIPGYRGLITLARRADAIKAIVARCVYANDSFVVRLGTDESITHEPTPLTEDKGDFIGVYAVAKLTTGEQVFEVMSKADVDLIRSRSKASDYGPWVTDYEAMAKKTVLRRLVKLLPMSVQLVNALDAEDQGVEDATSPVKVTLADKAKAAKANAEMVVIDVEPEPQEETNG